MYGSASKVVSLDDPSFYTFSNDIFITKTHVRALNQPTQKCIQEINAINTSACIAGFIEQQVGCNANIMGNQYSEDNPCNTKAQLLALANVSSMLSQANENDLYDMTGCLSPCEKNQYSLFKGPIEKIVAHWSHDTLGELHLRFIIEDSTYKEEEQYIIYDMNSFIADVGGYMGLLLGSSLLSLYNEIESLFRKLISITF